MGLGLEEWSSGEKSREKDEKNDCEWGMTCSILLNYGSDFFQMEWHRRYSLFFKIPKLSKGVFSRFLARWKLDEGRGWMLVGLRRKNR